MHLDFETAGTGRRDMVRRRLLPAGRRTGATPLDPLAESAASPVADGVRKPCRPS